MLKLDKYWHWDRYLELPFGIWILVSLWNNLEIFESPFCEFTSEDGETYCCWCGNPPPETHTQSLEESSYIHCYSRKRSSEIGIDWDFDFLKDYRFNFEIWIPHFQISIWR